MEREAVQSSAIRSIGYDADASTLEVEFQHGRAYRYHGVPEFLYRGLMLAQSKGHFFNTRIGDRYPCVEVAEPQPRGI